MADRIPIGTGLSDLLTLKGIDSNFIELFNKILELDAKGNAIHKLVKTNLEDSDDSLLSQLTSNTSIVIKAGDIALITTVIDGKTFENSAYIRNEENTAWEAITGKVDADKVILHENITLAGDYVSVGNISKGSTVSTATFETKGKSVAEALREIFSKRLQPEIIEDPSVTGFSLTSAGGKEAGTVITSTTFSGAVFNDGAYTYDDITGVSVSAWSVSRLTKEGSSTTEDTTNNIATDTSGTDTNSGNGFTIGDQTGAFNSLRYKITATYGNGNIAKDNLGDNSSPTVRIAGATTSQTTSAITSYRNYFMGTVSTASPPNTSSAITSSFIRDTIKYNTSSTPNGSSARGAYSSGSKSLYIPNGTTGVYIACISGKTGVTKVFNTATNEYIEGVFTKVSNVSIKGANGYTGVNYNVWYYVPAAPFSSDITLNVTLG